MSPHVGFKCHKRWCLPHGVWKLAPQIWRYITKRSASASPELEMRNLNCNSFLSKERKGLGGLYCTRKSDMY